MSVNKKISIVYFAKLRELRGLKEEKYETDAVTAQDLFNELNDKYHFHINFKDLKVAINDEFVEWDMNINENDNIVFIPPVAGG